MTPNYFVELLDRVVGHSSEDVFATHWVFVGRELVGVGIVKMDESLVPCRLVGSVLPCKFELIDELEHLLTALCQPTA